MQQDAVYTVSMVNYFPTAAYRTITLQLVLLSKAGGDITSVNTCRLKTG